jgi:hypothetical protein
MGKMAMIIAFIPTPVVIVTIENNAFTNGVPILEVFTQGTDRGRQCAVSQFSDEEHRIILGHDQVSGTGVMDSVVVAPATSASSPSSSGSGVGVRDALVDRSLRSSSSFSVD